MSIISIVRIAPRPDGGFDFDNEGEWAFAIQVYGFEVEMIDVDQDGIPVEGMVYNVVDLLAWLPDSPGTWWMRRGDETPILGSRNLAMAAYHGDSITLHQNPHEWLLGGRRGACVIKWGWPLGDLFADVGEIECSSVPLKRKLVASLRRWEPRVVVRKGVRHEA